MNTILKYILTMIPYIVIAVPIYVIVRVVILKRKQVKINWYREIVLFLFIMFLVGLFSLTIIPKLEIDMAGKLTIVKTRVHKTNLIPFRVILETYQEAFVHGNLNYFLINFLGNIVMFLPIGFCIPLLWNVSGKKVIMIGFGISLLIEFTQLFLSRGTDIDDLILNTIGVFLGLLLCRVLEHKNKYVVEKLKNR